MNIEDIKNKLSIIDEALNDIVESVKKNNKVGEADWRLYGKFATEHKKITDEIKESNEWRDYYSLWEDETDKLHDFRQQLNNVEAGNDKDFGKYKFQYEVELTIGSPFDSYSWTHQKEKVIVWTNDDEDDWKLPEELGETLEREHKHEKYNGDFEVLSKVFIAKNPNDFKHLYFVQFTNNEGKVYMTTQVPANSKNDAMHLLSIDPFFKDKVTQISSLQEIF